MLIVKFFITALLLLRLFPAMLKAQRFFETEISCNGDCLVDTALFYKDLLQETSIAHNAALNTNLFGPYFDQFPQIRSDILATLCYYPELANARIRFSYKPISQTMNSRPTPGNIFRKKANRHYSIIVNNNQGKHKGLTFEKLSPTIKAGWIGHELAHICEYEKMNNFETFWFAVKYVFSKKFIRKVERYTDLVTIEHGLAFPLYDGTQYLLQSDEIEAKYRKYTITNGLSLSEIICLWCKCKEVKNSISGSKTAKGNH